jgi:ParB family chromosome partitioning protein
MVKKAAAVKEPQKLEISITAGVAAALGMAEPPAPRVERFEPGLPMQAIFEHPDNPRKNFDQAGLEELAASIRSKGLLQPIVVRPVRVEHIEPTAYQIVCGARRYRACAIAGLKTVPAIVREMTDAEAIECMAIENLQREDLTEIEEARGFENWVKMHGSRPEALLELARIVGKSDTYIRRRLKVLELPKDILDLWEKGELIYGHLELLVRMGNPKRGKELLTELMRWGKDARTAERFRELIARASPLLSAAKFPKAQCAECEKNTGAADRLFGAEDGVGKTKRCLDPGCFKHHQGDWLLAHWSETADGKKIGTNACRFQGDLLPNHYSTIYNTTKAKCLGCLDYATVVHLSGEPGYPERACLKPSCYRETYKERVSSVSAHVDWRTLRGDVLRKRIPEVCADVALDDVRWLRLGAVLISSGWEAEKAFNKEVFGKEDRIDDGKRFALMQAMTPEEAKAAFVKSLIIRMSLIGSYGDTLGAVCSMFGVGMEGFIIDEKFLRNFDEAGLRALGKELGIWQDQQVINYAVGRKEAGKWDSADSSKMERKQLVACFLKSGIDLKGKVPKRLIEAE